MSKLTACGHCGHFVLDATACPFCADGAASTARPLVRRLGVNLLHVSAAVGISASAVACYGQIPRPVEAYDQARVPCADGFADQGQGCAPVQLDECTPGDPTTCASPLTCIDSTAHDMATGRVRGFGPHCATACTDDGACGSALRCVGFEDGFGECVAR